MSPGEARLIEAKIVLLDVVDSNLSVRRGKITSEDRRTKYHQPPIMLELVRLLLGVKIWLEAGGDQRGVKDRFRDLEEKPFGVDR